MTSPCKPGERPPGRHDLVFVSPEGWRALLEMRGDLAADPLVARAGPSKGWPTIRRRAHARRGAGAWHWACRCRPLPARSGSSFSLMSADVVSVARPPSLREVRARRRRATGGLTLDRLDELGAPACGGSAGIRQPGLAVADRARLRDRPFRSRPPARMSDRETDLDRLAADLAAIETDAPMRLDGELMRARWRCGELARIPRRCERASGQDASSGVSRARQASLHFGSDGIMITAAARGAERLVSAPEREVRLPMPLPSATVAAHCLRHGAGNLAEAGAREPCRQWQSRRHGCRHVSPQRCGHQALLPTARRRGRAWLRHGTAEDHRPGGRSAPCSRRPPASTPIAARSSASGCCARRPVRGPAGWPIPGCRSAMSWLASGAAAYSMVRCCCTAMAAPRAAAFTRAARASRPRPDFPASTGSACPPCAGRRRPCPRKRKPPGSRRASP